jgi:hypothetical protein
MTASRLKRFCRTFSTLLRLKPARAGQGIHEARGVPARPRAEAGLRRWGASRPWGAFWIGIAGVCPGEEPWREGSGSRPSRKVEGGRRRRARRLRSGEASAPRPTPGGRSAARTAMGRTWPKAPAAAPASAPIGRPAPVLSYGWRRRAGSRGREPTLRSAQESALPPSRPAGS